MNQAIEQANKVREQIDGFINYFTDRIDVWISSGDKEDFTDSVTRDDDEPALFNRIVIEVQSELSKRYRDFEVQVTNTDRHGNLSITVSRLPL